jgi:ribosome-associated protein
MMETQEKLKTVLDLLDEMKASDVVTVDGANRTILTDFFVLATATSDTHAKALTNHLTVKLKGLGVPPNHVEVDPGREWTILDLDDVIVHLFLERARTFYNLEELWGLVQTVRKKEPGTSPRTRSR